MEELIQKIEEEYGLTVEKHEVMRDTDKSLVIVLNTSRGKYIGKTLYITPERQEFILDAEEHLRKKGVLIPEVRKTKTKNRFIDWIGSPFILQTWVSWPMIALNSPARIERIGATLGMIHARSRGFSSKQGYLYNGALTWESEYQQDLSALESWYSQHKKDTDPTTALLAKYIPAFLGAGYAASLQLEKSRYYSKWKQQPLRKHFLCHGDFNNGNLLSSKQKITVIDWEDVRYDFPSKDIMRLLYLLMRKKGRWSSQTFTRLMTGYLGQNSLSRAQRHLLFADLAFPHMVERYLRHRQYNEMSSAEVEQYLRRETNKTTYMQSKMKALA